MTVKTIPIKKIINQNSPPPPTTTTMSAKYGKKLPNSTIINSSNSTKHVNISSSADSSSEISQNKVNSNNSTTISTNSSTTTNNWSSFDNSKEESFSNKNNMDLNLETKKLLEKIKKFDLNNNVETSDDEEINNTISNSNNIKPIKTVSSNMLIPMNIDSNEQTKILVNKIKETQTRSRSSIPKASANESLRSSRTKLETNSTKQHQPEAKKSLQDLYRTKSTSDSLNNNNSNLTKKAGGFRYSNEGRTKTISTIQLTGTNTASTNLVKERRGNSVVIEESNRAYPLNPKFFSSKLTGLESIRLNETNESTISSKLNKSKINNNLTLDSSFASFEPGQTKTSRLRLISNKKYFDLDKNLNKNLSEISAAKSKYVFQKKNLTSTPLNTSKSSESYINKFEVITKEDEIDDEEMQYVKDEPGEGTITLNFDLPKDINPNKINVSLDEKNENLIIESGDKRDSYYVISLPKNSVFDDLEYCVEKVESILTNKVNELKSKNLKIKEEEEEKYRAMKEELSLNLELSMNIDLDKEIDPSKILVHLNEDNIIVESKELNDVLYAVAIPENTDFNRMEYSLEKINTQKSINNGSTLTRGILSAFGSGTSKFETGHIFRQFRKIQV